MKLYDTRARQAVEIQPADGSTLKLYACGPTVYRFAHVGNVRTFLLTDLIARAAALAGFGIKIVQNITDVGHMIDDTGLGGADEGQGDTEDKLLAQSKVEQKSALEIARFYEAAFHTDLARMNIRAADAYPRASETIDLMIELISTLIDRGHAYVGGDGSVFFDARSCEDYGAISGNRLDALKPGHRFDGESDPNKRFHADWALWKFAPATRTQLVWETPWGAGFPGWHTECSAMSLDELGDVIDIHTGGIDLRFPHHEDERAQSNAFAGHDVVRHWVHAEHLLFDGRKMSKSTGNVVLVQDVIDRGFDPLALRLAFLSSRYRTQIDLTWDSIAAADVQIKKWRQRVSDCTEVGVVDAHAQQAFVDAFLDDLDTPRALQVVREFDKSSASEADKVALLLWADQSLGLDLDRPVEAAVVPDEVTQLVEQRAAARAAKDWAASDSLRDQIAALGWTVRDTAAGQDLSPN
jgi:cysteinyl-tRNA synthetase